MKTLIIAEAGVNHNGQLNLALQLIHAAAKAGADYVKFQTFQASSLVSQSAPKADYQMANDPNSGSSQLQMLQALQLSHADFQRLQEECKNCGIGFLSTPFDSASINFLASLGMDFWKIPSGEITNLPYLRQIAAHPQPIILSTGMATLNEVEQALNALEAAGKPRSEIYLLHCTTAYPTAPDQVNLRAMQALQSLNCKAIGYSDHTQGIAIPTAAVALGAQIIEKHFTLSRSLPGPDHKASLTPSELTEMVQAIRAVEASLGTAIKQPTEAEQANINIARRSIVAAKPIAAGETFTPDNLTTKRPANGISPMLWDTIIGTTASRPYMPDQPIQLQ